MCRAKVYLLVTLGPTSSCNTAAFRQRISKQDNTIDTTCFCFHHKRCWWLVAALVLDLKCNKIMFCAASTSSASTAKLHELSASAPLQ